jgi:hypothetical protein
MTNIIRNIVIYMTAAVLAAAIMQGCTGREVKTAEKNSTETAPGTAGKADNPTLVFGSDRTNSRKTSKGDKQEVQYENVDAADTRAQLFPVVSKSAVPEDMKIGPLYDAAEIDGNRKKFVGAVMTFFNAAMDGRINGSVLHPDWRDSIKRIYEGRLPVMQYSVRIGTIREDDGRYSANIRLVGDEGRTAGNVTASDSNGKLLISDISVDIAALEKKYQRSESEFTPMKYSNILLEY